MASINFINECKNPAYENRYGKLYIGNGDELNQSNVIQNFTIDSGAYNNGSIIGSVYCKKLNAQLIDSLNKTLENESITAQVGVKYNDNTKEYINLGKYNIEKPKDELTDNYTSFVAYDDLANKIDKVYVSNINYLTPKTLGDLYQDVCINLDLVPKTTTFLNSDIPITNNPFTNKETNRFVLETICKIAASYVDVDVENNKIDLVWLSDNEEPDYTFLKSDYSTVNGGKVIYGPVNSLTIRSTSVESENVTINDTESIEEYGEHSIIIADDYILNTPQLRQQALTGIWNRLHNLQYVDCELTTLTGKPFLKIGKKIRIYTSEEEYFDTYVLQHEFTYDGTFKSVIKSPAMTEQEVAIKQEISLGEKLSLTSLTVDKQNQTIQSVVSNVGVQDEKISQITQTVNEINSKISDIADITTSAEDTDAVVELNEINTSEPIQIKIHPTGTNISYLYPSTNLYPSEDLYMRDRRIRFHNTTTDENFDFILPDDLLYYDSEHYDEFLLDYGDGTPETQLCQVTKRCKYNADGTVSLLSQEEITNYTYPSIPLTDGDYEVSIYGYQQGYIFTRLMAKNIYTTQFYTKAETNTLISQTAESITLEANTKFIAVNGRIDENNARIVANSNAITSEVTRAENSESSLSTRITQNANGITSLVSSKVGNNEVISKINQSAEQVSINANKINIGDVITAINDDTSQVQVKADKIDFDGKEFNVTTESMKISVGQGVNKKELINSSGLMTAFIVQGNLISASFVGGTCMLPVGFSNQGSGYKKDRLEFEFTIPAGFVINKAYVTLNHMPATIKYDYGSTITGYCRNMTLYKATSYGNGKKIIDLDHYSTIEENGITYSSVGYSFTGNSTGFSSETSGDIKSYISTNLNSDTFNKFKIETTTNTPTSYADMYSKNGCLQGTMTIIGHMKF